MHEVLVVEVALKARHVPEEVLALVAQANPHKLLFVCTHSGEACLAVMLKRLVVGPWRPFDRLTLDMNASDVDAVWDSLASQVVYNDAGGGPETIEERFEVDAKIKALYEELARVEARGRKERQVARKNALFDKAKELKRRIAKIEEGR